MIPPTGSGVCAKRRTKVDDDGHHRIYFAEKLSWDQYISKWSLYHQRASVLESLVKKQYESSNSW